MKLGNHTGWPQDKLLLQLEVTSSHTATYTGWPEDRVLWAPGAPTEVGRAETPPLEPFISGSDVQQFSCFLAIFRCMG
jgi:hypothetical protein